MVDAHLQTAVAFHQRGKLTEAERLYRDILKVAPDHFDALHLLGILKQQQNQSSEALALIGAALLKRPNEVKALSNYGAVLVELKRFDEALPYYYKAIALKPDYAEGYYNLGIALNELKRFIEALASYDRGIALKPDYAEAFNNRGNTLTELKRLDDALASYDKAIAFMPGCAEAFNNRGNVLSELRRFPEAVTSYDQAIACRPNYAAAYLNRGNALKAMRRFDEALTNYEQAITQQPNYAAAFFSRGNALHELKRFDAALASYNKAIALAPDYAEAFNNRGVTFIEVAYFDKALASFDRAVALKPDYAEAFFNRAIALEELKHFDEALASYERALAQSPHYAGCHYNRGNLLREVERFHEALASYDKAIACRPDYYEAFINRGAILNQLGRFTEALASLDKAIGLQSDNAEAFNNRGNALKELKRFDEAVASYSQALILKPAYAECHYNLGLALVEQGRRAQAVTHYERALALKPDYAEANFAACMGQLPILYADEPEIIERRAAYTERLEALCDAVEGRRIPGDLTKAIGSTQPFLLAYQGYNDRDLQSLYGSLLCRIMAERYPSPALAPPPRGDEPVRIGIVSGYFRHHTVWKLLIRGWLSQINRRRFRLFGYYTGVQEDAETRQAVDLCDRFTRGPKSIERWRQTILDDAPHILIYPEVGMDPIVVQLAAQRLARVQCNSWGHPDTSGLSTLDYFLSSELMEPPQARDHYTEHLVCLPHLSIYYEPLDLPPVSCNRAELGLRSSATLYWSGQSLFKYLPQFDEVFARIALQVRDCQFVFIQHQSVTINQLFLQRLDRAFAAVGLSAAEYCVLLPRLDVDRFIAAIGECDIALDTIGWSGGNTTLESLHHCLPIVTMSGRLMRGRHTMAILKMMDITETTAVSVDDYVSIAVRLAHDLSWRTAIRSKMSENRTRVYRDAPCIAALEDFLDRAARRAST
jgi:protein O-GlcNAc transferase